MEGGCCLLTIVIEDTTTMCPLRCSLASTRWNLHGNRDPSLIQPSVIWTKSEWSGWWLVEWLVEWLVGGDGGVVGETAAFALRLLLQSTQGQLWLRGLPAVDSDVAAVTVPKLTGW